MFIILDEETQLPITHREFDCSNPRSIAMFANEDLAEGALRETINRHSRQLKVMSWIDWMEKAGHAKSQA